MSRLSTNTPARWYAVTRQVLRLCVAILLMPGLPEISLAAIYSCATSDGGIVFQDRPCRIMATQARPIPREFHQPLGIHASWFELPEQANERAYCDRRGCECGEVKRKLDNSLDQVVADALYMDGTWHRYETSFQRWRAAPVNSATTMNLRQLMHEDACNVMISQQLLRRYADEVTSELRKKVSVAQARGFDQPEPCAAGVEQACDYLDAVRMLRQMLDDASTLQVPRDTLTGEASLPLDR